MNDSVIVSPRPRRFRFRGVRPVHAAAVAALALVAFGAVPPLRSFASSGASKLLLAAASPLAPDIENFADLPQGTKVLASDGSVLAELNGSQRREPVRLDALPAHVAQAVLAAEDARFRSHGGVDPAAVFRAFLRTARGDTQGGSTITQQLAKINYTKSERTVLRKLRELQYAVRLEEHYSKDQLLERYLNQVYFGDGAYGIAAAAATFFGVPAEQLTPAQAALLAGKIRAPERLDPRTRPEVVQRRRDQVLRNMRRHGWLTPQQLDEALATPLVLAAPRPQDQPARAPHFVEYVKREASRIDALGGSPEARSHQLFTGGYTIRTTLDPAAFEVSAGVVQRTLGAPGDPATAVVSVKPGDGAITNLFGGTGFDRKFDVASQGRRQPGSAFKPFVYLAALRDGIDPRSRLDGTSPRQLEHRGERYTVHNYADGQGAGRMTIDEAMVKSINTVFAQLILEVGPENVADVAESLGMEDVNHDPAIALGGLRNGVTPLQMAAAYAALAAKGEYAEPYAIEAITNRHGQVIYGRERRTRRVLEPKEAGVLNAALLQVVERGTATAAQIGRPAAGKTGTTQNYRDAWFVGFVPQVATAVWVGYPQEERPMTDVRGVRVSGGSFPARMWSDYMRQVVAGLPVAPVPTASPESLSLRPLGVEDAPGDTVTTTAPAAPQPAPAPSTTTTLPPPSTTSTTAPATTTTTAKPERSTTTTTAPATTTTTAKPRPTTTSTTVSSSSDGGATTTTTSP